MSDVDLVTEEGIPVKLPSGASFVVLTSEEVSYVDNLVTRYLADNHFVNISDFQDVDRMLMMETLCFRWAHWISRQRDYFGEAVDESALRRSLNDYSSELRQLKKMLGIDKAARDRAKGDDSIPVYLENLLTRAKEFGVMRESQSSKAIELAMELRKLMTLHDNSDDIERREMHITQEDLLEWVRTVFVPEMSGIDEYFRTHVQKYWIKSQ